MTRPTRRSLAGLAALAVVALAAVGAWKAAAPPRSVSLHDRAVAIERTLRCPTCQGMSVADSPSPIAAGMRQQIEHQLAAGATPAQVRGYFTARYSDWILLDPPRHGIGWLPWAAPPLLLAAGLLLLRRTLRRRAPPAELTQHDLEAAAAFAADPPEVELPESVAAALADLAAARTDAELELAAQPATEEALARLSTALRDHPTSPSEAVAVAVAVHGDQPGDVTDTDATDPVPRAEARHRPARYALPAAAAVLFAGLLAVTLSQAVGQRPPGGLPTGQFATPTPPAAATPSGGQLAALAAATRAHPKDPRAWLGYATALNEAGRLAAAEPAYRRVLALDPTNVAAREQLVWLLTRGGSAREALTLLAPLTRQRPDDPQVVLLLGLAQHGAGRRQATATLRRYLRLAPTSAQAPVVRALLGDAS